MPNEHIDNTVSREKQAVCPCCGSAMSAGDIRAIEALSLPPNERRVLDELLAVFPRSLSSFEIAQRVYRHEVNGGPLAANRNIDVYLCRLRPKVSRYGWQISAAGGGGVRLRPMVTT